MTIAEILEIKEITLLEPTFSDLLYLDAEDLLLHQKIKDGKILVDEDENPILFAGLDENNTWIGCCTLFRAPTVPLIEFFEQVNWDMYQEKKETILDALREYYSRELQKTTASGPNDLNLDRADIVDKLLMNTCSLQVGSICLDCCCGTGVGSMVLRKHGLNPIAYDNDESLLVRGIVEGRLLPEKTMWIDGRLINNFLIKPVSLACGFMIGEIHSFNAHIWREIITAACAASENILFTAGTEPEIIQIREWVEESGKKVRIFESDYDPIYDRWVCCSG
ncbi:MAG: hypothetical protein GXY48_14770 [Methanomicrobiales archaeon]|nr:hypothetical protein [Methanomicrobiales archaeon]